MFEKKEFWTRVTARLTAQYFVRTAEADEVILLLHGYSQTGEKFYEKIEGFLPKNVTVISASGVFPIPVYEDNGSFTPAYSWYFRDSKMSNYYVDMEAAKEYLLQIIDHAGVAESPKRIIGYSQGGYLAPFVAQVLSNVRQVIGIACQFRHEELNGELPFRLDAVHGGKDTVVDPKRAQESHTILNRRGVKGDFILLPEFDHRLSEPLLREVQTLLTRS